MKISCDYQYTPNLNRSQLRQRTWQSAQLQRVKNDSVSFTGTGIIKNICSKIPFFTKKLNKYSIDEYNKLSPLEKKILRFEYKACTSPLDRVFYKNTEDIHDYVSDCMINTLDKKYGKKQYTVVAIGRSLSSISKVLGYKIGENRVKNIPLSDAGRFTDIDILRGTNKTEINKFKDYLKSIGLTDKFVKKSGQKIVLTDFCASGRSLEGAGKLFNSSRLFGKKSPIYTEGIDDLLPHKENMSQFLITLREYLIEGLFKQFSFVDRSNSLSGTKKSIRNTDKSTKNAKLMWFKLLDNFMTGKKADMSNIKNMHDC